MVRGAEAMLIVIILAIGAVVVAWRTGYMLGHNEGYRQASKDLEEYNNDDQGDYEI